MTILNTAAREQEIKWIIDDKYKGEKNHQDLDKDIGRLDKGEPVDYIIGYKDFLGCKIDLSYRPLIPREETAFWVDLVLSEGLRTPSESSEFRVQSSSLKILDIFSGSGCIGTSLLHHLKNSNVDFIEVDRNLLKQVELNLKINDISPNRFKVVNSNLFENIEGKYNYIFANPPYCETSQVEKVQDSVYAHEPHLALFGGEDGLDIIRDFLVQAKNHLLPGGKIFMEFGEGQKDGVTKIIEDNYYSSFEFKKDQFGKWRWVMIQVI